MTKDILESIKLKKAELDKQYNAVSAKRSEINRQIQAAKNQVKLLTDEQLRLEGRYKEIASLEKEFSTKDNNENGHKKGVTTT